MHRLDYLVGCLLILSPFLFGFVSVDLARNVFIFTGVFVLFYCLFPKIPVRLNMTFDVLVGIFLLSAPWLLHYHELISPLQEYWQYALAVLLFLSVTLSQVKTIESRRPQPILEGV